MKRKFIQLVLWMLSIFLIIFLLLPAIRTISFIEKSMNRSMKYGINNESLYYSSTPECSEAGYYFKNRSNKKKYADD